MINIIILAVTPDSSTNTGVLEDVELDARGIPSLIIWQLVNNPVSATITGHYWDAKKNKKKPDGIFGDFSIAPGGQWACMTDYHTDPNTSDGDWWYHIQVQCDRKGRKKSLTIGGSNNPNIKNR